MVPNLGNAQVEICLLKEMMEWFKRSKKSSGKSESEPNGRYGVFDQNANPISVHDHLSDAAESWKKETKNQGSIFDLENNRDVTPKPSLLKKILNWLRGKKCKKPVFDPEDFKSHPLKKEDMKMIEGLIAWPGKQRGSDFEPVPDPQNLMKFIEAVDKLNLPVFNISKKRWEKTQKLVPVKKMKRLVRKKTICIFEERTVNFTQAAVVSSIIPENEISLRRIQKISEIKRVSPKMNLALPGALLARRLLARQLMVIEYLKDEHQQRQVKESVPKEIVVDEPYLQEYQDFLEMAQEPKGQLLFILRDVSGSMNDNGCIGDYISAAVASVVVGRNINNSSLYFDAPFGTGGLLEEPTKSETINQKKELIEKFAQQFNGNSGTSIASALETAAQAIRSIAKPDDQPEILLITDGQDHLSAEDVYDIIKEDIILHTVLINHKNESLLQHSSTYVQLSGYGPEDLKLTS